MLNAILYWKRVSNQLWVAANIRSNSYNKGVINLISFGQQSKSRPLYLDRYGLFYAEPGEMIPEIRKAGETVCGPTPRLILIPNLIPNLKVYTLLDWAVLCAAAGAAWADVVHTAFPRHWRGENRRYSQENILMFAWNIRIICFFPFGDSLCLCSRFYAKPSDIPPRAAHPAVPDTVWIASRGML